MAKRVAEKARGILNPKLGEQKFHLARYEPTPQLAFFVEHYWTVKWDLRGETPYNSETLPHPSVHLTVEPHKANIVGVVTRKFSRLLTEQGWVFGIKFKPGAFHPFAQQPISTFTDRNLPLEYLLGEVGERYVTSIRAAADEPERCDEIRVALAEEFLGSLAPAPDENVALVGEIVHAIMTNRAITKVDQLVDHFKRNKRALQRLFSEYVGVSPKWTIQRYRLHEATEQVAAGERVDWARLAVDLGYFDQAHFIKDFKAIVGVTPADYAKQLE